MGLWAGWTSGDSVGLLGLRVEAIDGSPCWGKAEVGYWKIFCWIWGIRLALGCGPVLPSIPVFKAPVDPWRELRGLGCESVLGTSGEKGLVDEGGIPGVVL